MPWLTPDSIPEDDDCRPLSIPADSAWLALVSGALTELTLPYNWQKFGTLTVQETVDKMQSIIDNYYNSPCAMCVTPGGYRVTRISSTGHMQELNSDGSWEDATGDYAIPSPAARTEGTEQDQNCLAAKNATNVLFQLYESLSDSFSSELTAAEALTAFATSAIAAIGFEFAPITFSIAAFMFVVFEALFAALGYLTADLWTDDFTKAFECLLLNCVMNDAGVVTFDWDCLQAALIAQTDTFGLSELQLRLYLQISYILYFIGGVDGLNLAARTTDITNDDCSFCEGLNCGYVDFTTGLHGWSILNDGTINARGEYVSGTGIETTLVGDSPDEIYVYYRFTEFNVRRIGIMGHQFPSGSPTGVLDILLSGSTVAHVPFTPPFVADFYNEWNGNENTDGINFTLTLPGGGALERLIFYTAGDLPEWLTPC